MKSHLLLLLLLCAVRAESQTFTRYILKDWVPYESQTNSNYIVTYYTNSLSFDVPANTIFKGTVVYGGNAGIASVEAKYEDAIDRVSIGITGGSGIVPTPIIGPATVYLSGESSSYTALVEGFNSSSAGVIVLLAEFDPVNVTPALTGYGVQPNGKTAAVSLETSRNLQTWQTATNGIYPATNSAAFFRLNFQVN